jgi:hypothetical protein
VATFTTVAPQREGLAAPPASLATECHAQHLGVRTNLQRNVTTDILVALESPDTNELIKKVHQSS